jgi:hypothetical protein
MGQPLFQVALKALNHEVANAHPQLHSNPWRHLEDHPADPPTRKNTDRIEESTSESWCRFILFMDV